MIRGLAGMSHKLKFVLGVLIVVAGFFVYRAGSLLLPPTTDQAGTETLRTKQLTANIGVTNRDSDHDGLNDSREIDFSTDANNRDTDSDGYLDGEEVVSGFDPTIKGEDSLKRSPRLTDLFTELLVAGVAAGDLNPKNGKGETYQKGVALISNAIANEARAILANDPAAEKVRVVPTTEQSLKEYRDFFQDTFGDEYFFKTHNTIDVNLQKAIDKINANDMPGARKIFSEYADLYSGKLVALQNQPVPELLAPFHKGISVEFSKLQKSFTALGANGDDPLLRHASLQQIARSYAYIKQFTLEEFTKLLANKP